MSDAVPIRIYREQGEGFEELAERAPGRRYRMATVQGRAAEIELNAQAEAAADQREDRFGAWQAFEAAHPGRRFTGRERRAFHAARERGETYLPDPLPPTTDQRLDAILAAQQTLIASVQAVADRVSALEQRPAGGGGGGGRP